MWILSLNGFLYPVHSSLWILAPRSKRLSNYWVNVLILNEPICLTTKLKESGEFPITGPNVRTNIGGQTVIYDRSHSSVMLSPVSSKSREYLEWAEEKSPRDNDKLSHCPHQQSHVPCPMVPMVTSAGNDPGHSANWKHKLQMIVLTPRYHTPSHKWS